MTAADARALPDRIAALDLAVRGDATTAGLLTRIDRLEQVAAERKTQINLLTGALLTVAFKALLDLVQHLAI